MPISPRSRENASGAPFLMRCRTGRRRGRIGPVAVEDFAARDDHVFHPGAAGIQRHEFDEPKADAEARQLREPLQFVIIESPDDDGIDLDRIESDLLSEAYGPEDFVQAVPTRHALKVLLIERVEAEADPLEAGIAQGLAFSSEKKAIRGHGQIAKARNGRELRDEDFEFLAEERFTAGEANFINAQRDENLHETFDFFERQYFGTRFPLRRK